MFANMMVWSYCVKAFLSNGTVFQVRYMTQGPLGNSRVNLAVITSLINLQKNLIIQKSAFTLQYTLNEVKAWKNVPQNSAKKQCQDKYKQSMSKQQIKQQSSPRSEEAERVSTYRTLAWFSSPAMLRVTRARWITIDSRQNRTECHYEDLFRYFNEHAINAWLIDLHICSISCYFF